MPRLPSGACNTDPRRVIDSPLSNITVFVRDALRLDSDLWTTAVSNSRTIPTNEKLFQVLCTSNAGVLETSVRVAPSSLRAYEFNNLVSALATFRAGSLLSRIQRQYLNPYAPCRISVSMVRGSGSAASCPSPMTPTRVEDCQYHPPPPPRPPCEYASVLHNLRSARASESP